MIPASLLGVVAFAASIGPGYVWVSVAERRTPRGQRTQLRELAELVIVGGLASTLAFLIVATIANWASWLDTDALAADSTPYLLRHPTIALGIVFVGLALAYAGAYVAARVVYRGQPPIIEHGYHFTDASDSPRRGRAEQLLAERLAVRLGVAYPDNEKGP